eukprot:2698279-Rhodomonas_salina.1
MLVGAQRLDCGKLHGSARVVEPASNPAREDGRREVLQRLQDGGECAVPAQIVVRVISLSLPFLRLPGQSSTSAKTSHVCSRGGPGGQQRKTHQGQQIDRLIRPRPALLCVHAAPLHGHSPPFYPFGPRQQRGPALLGAAFELSARVNPERPPRVSHPPLQNLQVLHFGAQKRDNTSMHLASRVQPRSQRPECQHGPRSHGVLGRCVARRHPHQCQAEGCFGGGHAVEEEEQVRSAWVGHGCTPLRLRCKQLCDELLGSRTASGRHPMQQSPRTLRTLPLCCRCIELRPHQPEHATARRGKDLAQICDAGAGLSRCVVGLSADQQLQNAVPRPVGLHHVPRRQSCSSTKLIGADALQRVQGGGSEEWDALVHLHFQCSFARASSQQCAAEE